MTMKLEEIYQSFIAQGQANAVRPFFYYPASSVSGPFLVADGKIQSRLLGLHPRLFLRARRFGHGSLQTLSLRHQPSEEGTEKDQTAYFF